MSRVSKKLVPALSDIDGAILLVNAIDPQVATVRVFLDAIEDIPHFIVLNKVDAVTTTQAQEVVDEFYGKQVIMASTLEERGLTSVIDAVHQLPEGKIAILGIFNSGKTSLINCLTGSNWPVGDIPGTTLVLTPTQFGEYTLVDTIGQIIDVNKPLMVSIDLSMVHSIPEKVAECIRQEKIALTGINKSMPAIIEAVTEIRNRVAAGKKVIVTGAGASALVAMEMGGQGQETGLPILVFTNNFATAQPVSFAKGFAEDELALAEYTALSVNEGDVLIGISASGGTACVHEALRIAQEKGAFTIAITENADTPLGKYADLIIKSDAKPEGPSSSKIQTAHLAIGHTLMVTLADVRGVDAQTSIDFMMPKKMPNKKMGIK